MIRVSATCRPKVLVMLIAVAALVLLACLPAPCRAETRITVNFVFGGVCVGGIGFFIYISQSFPVGFQALAPQPAILTITQDGPRWGWTLPSILPIDHSVESCAAGGAFELDLIRWHF